MPIQFQCGTCAKPIEVDDEVAGRSAQCPFCRSVVQVPDHTTLARPSLHVESGPPPATQRPEPFGLIGLGLALVAYVLLCSGMYMTLKYIPGGFRAQGRWRYASGVAHAEWTLVSCTVGEGGAAVPWMFLVPIAEVRVLDE